MISTLWGAFFVFRYFVSSVYCDGACRAEKIKQFAPKGGHGFILGTTLLFGKNRDYGEIMKYIREMQF